jgi:hypothetical protein
METKTDYTTNQTKALTVAPQITPQMWQMIEAIGPAMHKARLFGVSNPEQAMAIVGLSPRGALALIQQSPLCTKLVINDITLGDGTPDGCEVYMERSNGFKYAVTVSSQHVEMESGRLLRRCGFPRHHWRDETGR